MTDNPATRRRNPLTPLLLALMLGHASFVGSRVAITLFGLKLNASAFEVGLLMTLYGLLPMFLSLAIGRMVDRIGAQHPMRVATSLLAVSLALPLAWPAMPALYISSAINGLVFVVVMIGIQNAVGRVGEPSERPTNFSRLSLSFSISGFLGPVAAGFAIDGIGHRYTFGVLALVAATSAILQMLGKYRLPGPAPRDRKGARGGLRELLLEPRMLRIFIASGLLSIAWDTYNFVIPLHGANIGLSASVIGIILGAFAVATFIIRAFIPLISRHFRPWPIILFSMLWSGACYLLFPWFNSALLLAALGFALGLGLGMSQPMVLSLVHGAAPEGRAGEAVGARAMLVTFSQTSIPLVFGAMGAALGMTPVFVSMSLSLLIGGWVVRRRRATPPA